MKTKPFSMFELNFEIFRKFFMVFLKGFAPEPVIWLKKWILKIWDHKIEDKGWNFFSIGKLLQKRFLRFSGAILLRCFWPSGVITGQAPCPESSPCGSKKPVKNRKNVFAKISRWKKSFNLYLEFYGLRFSKFTLWTK